MLARHKKLYKVNTDLIFTTYCQTSKDNTELIRSLENTRNLLGWLEVNNLVPPILSIGDDYPVLTWTHNYDDWVMSIKSKEIELDFYLFEECESVHRHVTSEFEGLLPKQCILDVLKATYQL